MERGTCTIAAAMIVLVTAAAMAQPSTENINKNSRQGTANDSVASEIGQRQPTERGSPGKQMQGKTSDQKDKSGSATSSGNAKPPSGKKVPMGSGGSGVTGAVGK